MTTEPYELSTVSGADREAVRHALSRILGTYALPNLAALAASDIPAEVKEVAILGARVPGDAGPPMMVRRTNAPITAHSGWVRSLDRYILGQNLITNGDFSNTSAFMLGSGVSISGGVLNAVGAVDILRQSGVLVSGTTYEFSFKYTSTVAYNLAIATEANNLLFVSGALGPNGTVSGSFVADGADFRVVASGAAFTGTLDDLVVLSTGWPVVGTPVSSSTNGGYWEYASRNQPLYTEWFGSQADYTYESLGTSLLDALDKATEFLTVTRPSVSLGGATLSGATIQLGYGNYYLPEKFRPNKAICVKGMGHGLTEGNTRVYVAAGKSAIHADAMLTTHGSPSIFRDIAFISRGFGGQTDKHGFIMEAPCVIEYCTFSGFGGSGISVAADINAVPIGTNANVWRVKNCDLIGNAVDGLYVTGGDANAGSSADCNFIGNGRWGLNDQCFLGNHHGPHHFDNNGTLDYGGPYRLTALGCSALGNYTEGGQARAYVGPGSLSIGGFQGSGFIVDGGGVLLGNAFHGGLSLYPPTDQVDNDKIGLVFRKYANVLYSLYLGGNAYDLRYIQDEGVVLQYNNLGADYAYGVTPPEGAAVRAPRIYRNEFFVPKRMYLGGGLGGMRQLCFESAAPTYQQITYEVGDTALNSTAKFAGRMCTSAGVNVPTTWASGTAYAVDVMLRTAAGRIYRCTRVPYDPDAWSEPGSTIKPTHVSGAVDYPEPNPHIDPSEGATIPGYSWLVVGSAPYGNFPWQSGYHYDVGGSYIYDKANNRYYQCIAIPTRPTPVFNQVWSMPNSTVEPTHTSGTVEAKEPNPSPSGSEPATIPGYVWEYVSNLPQTPAWANFGDFFADGTVTGLDLPSIADGGRSAVQTMTVTGAAIGDLGVTVTPTGTSLQGLEVSAWVDSANTVKFQVYNRTGAAVDLPISNWYGRVRKRSV